MNQSRNYDKFPTIPISSQSDVCTVGWNDIGAELRKIISFGRFVLCVECYPGVFEDALAAVLKQELRPERLLRTHQYFKSVDAVRHLVESFLTEDPVFGHINHLEVKDFFDPTRMGAAQEEVVGWREGLLLIVGTGATLLASRMDLLVYADLARWEIQQRQRRHQIGSLGAQNRDEKPSLLYKRGYFLDWRVADRLKREIWSRIDFVLDTHNPQSPKMIRGETLRLALRKVVKRPFRVVPFFDPGPWGGQWMKNVCELDPGVPNYAWCFDCVPEENSLLMRFGSHQIEIPSIDLVFAQPRELLGDAVHGRFGAEFPIRFDFLDTIQGGNLSLQVHPTTDYIYQHFGMMYTQDESYYLLDANKDASVFLGLREDASRNEMIYDLKRAQAGNYAFPVETYINRFPARKHDHFLIPAGTVHCSGRGSMVLEISATPYIFTFKLWDWDRLGLDGQPRPIHLDHGEKNIEWNRRTAWVRENLINRVTRVCCGDSWVEERTGLHEREFIETRRHWFTRPVLHHACGGLQVLNLVEGDEVVVSSPSNDFEPLVIHYAETFIVPASAGPYVISPSGDSADARHATIKAFVRINP